MSTTTSRQTAEERREAVLDAAAHEFARKGLHGASTDEIAKAAGISQPYLFRLFGTKKELYLATASREDGARPRGVPRSVAGLAGPGCARCDGKAYQDLIADRDRLLLMLQCFAHVDDPDVRAGRARSLERPVEVIEGVGGLTQEEVSVFFAKGMLLTVLTAAQLFSDPTPWGGRLIEGCRTTEYG